MINLRLLITLLRPFLLPAPENVEIIKRNCGDFTNHYIFLNMIQTRVSANMLIPNICHTYYVAGKCL